jgi:hypothetical protein
VIGDRPSDPDEQQGRNEAEVIEAKSPAWAVIYGMY